MRAVDEEAGGEAAKPFHTMSVERVHEALRRPPYSVPVGTISSEKVRKKVVQCVFSLVWRVCSWGYRFSDPKEQAYTVRSRGRGCVVVVCMYICRYIRMLNKCDSEKPGVEVVRRGVYCPTGWTIKKLLMGGLRSRGRVGLWLQVGTTAMLTSGTSGCRDISDAKKFFA